MSKLWWISFYENVKNHFSKPACFWNSDPLMEWIKESLIASPSTEPASLFPCLYYSNKRDNLDTVLFIFIPLFLLRKINLSWSLPSVFSFKFGFLMLTTNVTWLLEYQPVSTCSRVFRHRVSRSPALALQIRDETLRNPHDFLKDRQVYRDT